MPSRKASKPAKPSQTLSQFGELDTTPTSRQFQFPESKQSPPTSFQFPSTNSLNVPENPTGSSDEFGNEVDEVNLVQHPDLPDLPGRPTQNPAIIWSDAGTETRENSPELTAHTPRNLWDFGEDDIPTPLSSSISKDLPETNQFSIDHQGDLHFGLQSQIDFSETASTGGGSSPVTYTGTREPEDECALDLPTITHIDPKILSKTQHIPAKGPKPHLPMDEMYDATPAKALLNNNTTGHQKARPADLAKEHIPRNKKQATNPTKASKKRSMGERIRSELDFEGEDNPILRKHMSQRNVKPVSVQTTIERVEPSTKPSEPTPLKDQRSNQKAKRSRQRAKSPLRFDEITREFRDIAQADKPRPSPRMPIVSALREAAQASSSPATSTKKTSALKKNSTKMQRGVPSTQEQSKKPRKPYTRAAAKKRSDETPKGPNLGLKHVTRQAGAAAARNIESTRSPIIEVSSDPPSSDGNSCLSPLNPPGTADTTMDHLVREADKPVSHIIKPIPEKELNLAKRPKRLPKVWVLDKEDTYIPSNEPCKPNQQKAQKRKKGHQSEDSGKSKKQKNSHHAPDNTTRRQILGARDLNVQAHEVQQHKKGPRQEPQDGPSETRFAPSKPVAKGKVTRHYSISIAGSPVPMNDSASIADQSRSDGSSSNSGQADETISRKLNYGLLNARGRKFHPSPELDVELGTTCDKTRPAQLKLGNITNSRISKLVSAPAEDARKQRSPAQPFLPNCTNTDKDMHRQIVAALELQDVNLEQHGPADQGVHGKKETVSKRSPREIRDDVAEQLHGIVDVVTEHLQSREVTAHKAADAYQKSVLKCIKTIDMRFSQEKQSLEAEHQKDCARFMRHLDAATRAVQEGQQKRLAVEDQMADCLIVRRNLYCKAAKTMRAIHQQLLGQEETD